jgi:proteic killer suppression protein
MIRNFRDAETAKIMNRDVSRKLPSGIQCIALRKLLMLDAAVAILDLRIPPGNRLEKLDGDRFGQHSIRINDQWRICFRWQDGSALDVEITDYH